MRLKYLYTLFFLFYVAFLAAQTPVKIYGYVIGEDNRGIDFVNVNIAETGEGTTTDINGRYSFTAEIGDSATLVYSFVGYETLYYTIHPANKDYSITVQMKQLSTELEGVNVEGHRVQTSTKETLDLSQTRLLSTTTGGIESLFITFSGVSSNNELSSQYNVRGGNFDENSVYVNGIEVYRPLLIRSGEQEGLSFINPDMVQRVDFSSGGFDAEYGDKMSSVLDIQYKKPRSFESTISLGLLGATGYVGTGNDKFTQMHGIRYKTSAYLLGTLDTKAEYKPNFLDYQTYLTYRFNPKWELTFLGNFSQNTYKFVPTYRETRFGTSQNAMNLKIYFDGQEEDLFRTLFGAFTLNYKPLEYVRLSILASAFHSNENETYDISGEYEFNDPQSAGDTGESETGKVSGIGSYHEHARNRLKSTIAMLGHQGEAFLGDHKLKWGINGQFEQIADKISEWEWRDSVGYSLPYYPGMSGSTPGNGALTLKYNLKSDNSMASLRLQAYVQDTYRWETSSGRFTLTGGLRANYWSLNNEFLVSPRVSMAYVPYWERDFSFRFATGVYYQSPFYKELRREQVDEFGNGSIELNKDIKSPRSLHFLLGGDHYFRLWGRPFKFTTEAYMKLADRMISYSIDNVNVRYSGINDSKAYTAGLDLKLFGELVPGADSWINFSLMSSKEKIDGSDKWTPRPSEQRYSFSLLFQDYWPTNPRYKMNLRFIWNDGLPYASARDEDYRVAFRSSPYRRVDIGASRGLVSGLDKFMNKPFFKHFKSIWFNFEIFNLLNFHNEGSFYWITDANNDEWAAPNYLTGRQYNFKIILDFK